VSTTQGGAAQGGAPLLRARAVAKRYGEREALRDVDLEAHAGELVAVIGPNGAGKTTLLSILAGAQPPSAGEVSLPAEVDRGRASGAGTPGDVHDARAGAASAPMGSSRGGDSRVRARKARAGWGVGWVPQQPALYARLSVAENLELFARLEGVADPRATVAAMLAQTDLADRAQERVARLSGGNRQRVNIALGLLADPAVLVLDEPSSSLDPRQRERLWRFIVGLAQRGRCVVFSTHNVAEAERYAQRVLVLADGELLFSGTPAGLAHAAGSDGGLGFEGAFVAFLRARGH
jgi:ABC-2 type transport system ATP-binding protein